MPNVITKPLKVGMSSAEKAAQATAIRKLVVAQLIQPYSTSATYALGKFCSYDGTIYKCTTAITTAEAWNSSHWTVAKMNEVIDAINEAVASVDGKANVDGNYPTMTVGLSDNLIATNGLTTTNSFIMELTGGDQASAVSTGKMNLTLRGNSVVVNQIVKNPNFANTSNWNVADGTFSVASNIATFKATSNDGELRQTISLIKGHKYLRIAKIKLSAEPSGLVWLRTYLGLSGQYSDQFVDKTTTNWQYITSIFEVLENTTTSEGFAIRDNSTSDWVDIQIKKPIIIDLTQWFNGNIPQDVLDNPENFFHYYQGDLSYDTGHIENAQSTSLISRGINQWDEEWESGTINSSTGATQNDSNRIRSKNYIEVLPSTTYYIKAPTTTYVFCYDTDKNYLGAFSGSVANTTITTSSDCAYIKFSVGSSSNPITTYNHDICINISNPDINGNYFASESNETPLGNDVLRSAGSVYDSKAPNGLITRRVGVVDLGSLNWQKFDTSDGTLFRSDVISGANIPAYGLPNIICALYTTTLNNNRPNMSISCGVTNKVDIINNSYTDATAFKQAMSGVILYYELAEYTEEQGTPFSENIKVVKGGTLEFVGNGIPQGNSMFFQKNLKSFLEAFGTAINYDPSRIERLANLSFTPETADIVLNPSPANAYAKVQVMSSTFTIVVSAALTGTASGSITFQDSEVDLTNFETKPAEAIYDMDGKKVSEAPTTTDCNIASFVGRSYNGVILWSILHSGVNKIKIHFEQAIPLDENGNGKIDCRASLIL